jgi:hypothetical protein
LVLFAARPCVARAFYDYSDQRRNNSAPLVPPKPKEFDMA